MPHVRISAQQPGTTPQQTVSPQAVRPKQRPLRQKTLKLLQIEDPANNTLTNRYLLHYYFEVFQDGHRHYSPLYTEAIITDSGPQTAGQKERQESQKPHALQAPSPSSSAIKERVG